MLTRLPALLLLTLLVAASGTCAVVAWPTRYRYDRIQMPGETTPGPVFPVRIDRFTGAAEILLPEMLNDSRHNMALGWVGLAGSSVPGEVLAALRERTMIDVEPLPYAQIFNTTAWRITRLRWRVTARAAGAPAGSGAPSAFDQNVFIEPNSVARLYLELGRFGRDVSIALEAAWGQRVASDSRSGR